MSLTMELFSVLVQLPQVVDTIPYLECHPRKFLDADSCASWKITDMLIGLPNLLFLGELLETEKEHDIVREHDDLPGLRFLDQSPCHALSPLVVERGHRIVEHNGGTIVCRAELGEKRRDSETSLFPFADDFWKFDAWGTCED